MSDGDDLARRLDALVGTPAPLDVERLRATARRARRMRRVQQAVVGIAAVAVLVPVGLAVAELPGRGGATTAFTATGALAPFDPVLDVAPGVPALARHHAEAQPSRLPEGAVRCAGPSARAADAVVETAYCVGGEQVLRLLTGTHEQLPEAGVTVPVARRDGYLGNGPSLTVSDGNTLGDTHYRLEGALEPAALAEVAASIPAVAEAPPSPR